MELWANINIPYNRADHYTFKATKLKSTQPCPQPSTMPCNNNGASQKLNKSLSVTVTEHHLASEVSVHKLAEHLNKTSSTLC